jgi:hypothetical protein
MHAMSESDTIRVPEYLALYWGRRQFEQRENDLT